jgi:hypothetical protein
MLKMLGRTGARVAGVIEGWAKLRPEKRFFGKTLDEFRAEVKPFTDALRELAELQTQWDLVIARRDLASGPAMKATKKIVNAVKGDPEEGEDGPLYAAMGYVPESQRSTGLTRRRKSGQPGEAGNSA